MKEDTVKYDDVMLSKEDEYDARAWFAMSCLCSSGDAKFVYENTTMSENFDPKLDVFTCLKILDTIKGKEVGRFIIRCISTDDELHKVFSVGSLMVYPEYRRLGYAKIALKKVETYVAKALNVSSFTLCLETANIRLVRALDHTQWIRENKFRVGEEITGNIMQTYVIRHNTLGVG